MGRSVAEKSASEIGGREVSSSAGNEVVRVLASEVDDVGF
jgi:hypothetical protein